MAFSFLDSWMSVLHSPGAVRNPDVEAWVRRSIPGSMGFVTTHHPTHAALKRPSSITSAATMSASEALPVVRPFNEAGFHFGKVACRELVAIFEEGVALSDDTLRAVTGAERAGPLTGLFQGDRGQGNAARRHPVFINASPFGFGHSLFVPAVLDCRPQLLTSESFRSCCRLARLLATLEPDCRMGFNSLAAFASVNHCHMHVWKNSALWPGRATMPIEQSPRTLLWQGQVFSAISPSPDHASPGHSVQITVSAVEWPVAGVHLAASCGSAAVASRAVDAVVAVVDAALSDMQGANIPHHVVLWWSIDGSDSAAYSHVLNVLLLPRAEQRPTPVPSVAGPSADLNISVALLEICGLPTVMQMTQVGGPAGITAVQAMDALTEPHCVDILAAFSSVEWSGRVAQVVNSASERYCANRGRQS